MKVAYFDCQFGAAGDMLLAAMLDAGLDQAAWLSEVAKIALPLGTYRIEIERVQRCTIAAKKMNVIVANGEVAAHNARSSNWVAVQGAQTRSGGNTPDSEPTREHASLHSHTHALACENAIAHPHADDSLDHSHSHSHSHDHDHDTPIVAMSYVQDVISNSNISKSAKDLAHRVVARLGRCESAVHGMDHDAVIFHEVGAIDTIIDIIGFAIAYDMMGIEKSHVSAVPLGRGHVRTAHGIFPIPAPAVALMLAEVKAPTLDYEIDFECLTPTAVAILSEICPKWGSLPRFDESLAVGYGAGTKNTPNHPNVSRVLLGTVRS